MPTEVQIIDAQIDDVRRGLYRRVGFLPLGPQGFHNAWCRCPDLRARETALFDQRYDAKVRQDKADAQAERRAERIASAAFRDVSRAKYKTYDDIRQLARQMV